MANYEGAPTKARYGAALTLAALMLAGCGGGKKQEGIPNCPSGYDSSTVVLHQGSLIESYELAGQQLAKDYKLAPTVSEKKRVGVAFAQLFDESSSGGGLFHSITTDNGNHLTPDSYLADDPNELMCHTKGEDGGEVVVLSPNAIEAKAILSSVGIQVNLKGIVR